MIKSNKGLTLVEIIVSLAILGIIIAPLSSLFVSTIKINKDSENRMKADLLAQKYMEEEKHSDVTGEKNETISDGDFQINKKVEKYGSYSIQKGEGFNTNCQIEVEIENGKLNFKGDNSNSFELENNKLIQLEIKKDDGSIIVDFKHDSSTIKSYNMTLNEDINIKLNCKESSKVTFEINALEGVATKVYIVKSIDSNSEIEVINKKGNVYVYRNIYDDSAKRDEETWVYKITITVLKDNEELVKLVGLKRID
ncbi:type IV pilus modification PilV family protein [Tepidibacter thalassicus]|uniref:Prepilin-type N-terminal cleavage/methylation domain-containing protein n=1 Tax=Tepidibacter thalassicus DSM 15285 TaxID=1123350 RepID=A0A1M5T6C8_9FIRM|nr:type II secretion system protein [Tepidibacter thalassicus]SHH46238.1 prepilin-type N-terminal cleavage/methylation domain-containing protein [Tepidibacter thalassicus DSM 15285]